MSDYNIRFYTRNFNYNIIGVYFIKTTSSNLFGSVRSYQITRVSYINFIPGYARCYKCETPSEDLIMIACQPLHYDEGPKWS